MVVKNKDVEMNSHHVKREMYEVVKKVCFFHLIIFPTAWYFGTEYKGVWMVKLLFGNTSIDLFKIIIMFYIYFLLPVNILSLILCCLDKLLLTLNSKESGVVLKRVPEELILITVLFGGSPSAALVMHKLEYRTAKSDIDFQNRFYMDADGSLVNNVLLLAALYVWKY